MTIKVKKNIIMEENSNYRISSQNWNSIWRGFYNAYIFFSFCATNAMIFQYMVSGFTQMSLFFQINQT